MRSLRIVVADDERDTVLTLATVLEHEGHEVRGLYRGAEVEGAVREFKPHAVLLDIGMPDKSGWEVAQGLRDQYGTVRPLLIAISGRYNKGSDRILAELAGFDYHVGKPYDVNALLSLLKPLSD